ncbi:hypothetical protein ACKWRH_21375 [Bradyrhizobium sp. Pa8]|uniref:hypothetical protein n=1 Tax=Bradyrhizobium sp. Pa8 TaxID=3386552 RepID=UPI00403EFB3A
MAQFRKKPVTIEAFRWTGDADQTEDPIWIVEAIKRGDVMFHKLPLTMTIATLEGTMSASPGDWIIRGVKGEIYPCKPDIFAASYETADAPPRDLRTALQMAAGALRSMEHKSLVDPSSPITFVGDWAHFGTMSMMRSRSKES